MSRILVIGGGWAGCAAALAAAQCGAQVTLLERTDLLLGTGLVGGIYRNNGRLTALLEAQAMGCGQLFAVMDQTALHINIDFPGHKHAALYDVTRIESCVRALLKKYGIKLRFLCRAIDVAVRDDSIESVLVDDNEKMDADVFVETTGSAGGIPNCTRFGNGCAMCIIRCPSFGSRVSIAAKAGVMEIMGTRPDGRPGSMSGSCKLLKESLSPRLRLELEKKGQLVIPIPAHLRSTNNEYKACQQYNLPAYKENLILLDTGHVKLMSPFVPLDTLRCVPGLEEVRYLDPYAGGVGNSIRFTSVTPRDNTLKVEGIKNLFCAGEKAGFLVGHTEAVITGSLAGYNAASLALGKPQLQLPASLASGDIIAFANPALYRRQARVTRITFSGAAYFEQMKGKELYLTEGRAAAAKVKQEGLDNIFLSFM